MFRATCVLTALLASSCAPVKAAGLRPVEDFGANPANLSMQVYLPDGIGKGAPLVVLPHGCFQTVQAIVDHTGWVELADRHRFALLFPGTSKDNEPFGGCFRTWQAEHQSRGGGEPQTIANMINWLVKHEHLDPQRVFMSGMSSGGLATAVMLATYPELLAAGAVQSAYPYRCANSFDELKTCSLVQKTQDPETWGSLVLDANPDYGGKRPRISIWHGTADQLLLPANLELQLQQWAVVLGVDTNHYDADRIEGQERRRYRDERGAVVIETVSVAGMDHAIAIDPDGSPSCGSVAPYIVDADICAAEWIARWFGIVP